MHVYKACTVTSACYDIQGTVKIVSLYLDIIIMITWVHGPSDLYRYMEFTAELQISYIFLFLLWLFLSNPMFDHLLDSSHRDETNKWPNTGFNEEITQVKWIKVHLPHLIWSRVSVYHFACEVIFSSLIFKSCKILSFPSKIGWYIL